MGPEPPDTRIGLAGLGRVAERGYLPALALARGVRLAAVAEPDPGRRARLGSDVPAFASVRELLAAASVDALVVATPSGSHVADATLAATHGVPSLVEKPPAPRLAGAVALASLAPAPAIGFCRRFAPGLVALGNAASRLDGYRLELSLEASRDSWGAYGPGDGPLLDLGIHLVDLARWLAADEIVRVRRTHGADVSFELELARGTAVARCSHHRPYRESVVLRDARGRRKASWAEGGLARRVRARLAGDLRRGPLVPLLAAQLEAFAGSATATGPAALATAQDGVEAMRALEAITASEEAAGAWIALGNRTDAA